MSKTELVSHVAAVRPPRRLPTTEWLTPCSPSSPTRSHETSHQPLLGSGSSPSDAAPRVRDAIPEPGSRSPSRRRRCRRSSRLYALRGAVNERRNGPGGNQLALSFRNATARTNIDGLTSPSWRIQCIATAAKTSTTAHRHTRMGVGKLRRYKATRLGQSVNPVGRHTRGKIMATRKNLRSTVRQFMAVLTLTISALVAPSNTLAQQVDNARSIAAMNTLAARFSEMNYRYNSLTNEYLNTTRSEFCRDVSSIPIDDTIANAAMAAVQQGTESLRQELGTDFQLRNIFEDGNQYTDFMVGEHAALNQNELSEYSAELITQLLINFRPYASSLDDERIDSIMSNSSLYSAKLRQSIFLLCHDTQSPEMNESSSTWKSWLLAATKFVGGLVLVGVNVTLPNPVISAPSAVLGTIAAGSGFGDLDSLIKREIGQ